MDRVGPGTLSGAWHHGPVSEKQAQPGHRSRPTTAEFRDFVSRGWAPAPASTVSLAPVAPYAAARRQAVSEAFPGERLVIPAGGFKVRSNDTDYAFRPHSAFAHLSGLGADREPDAVLVLEPLPEGGHEAVLFLRPMAGRDSEEFFSDARVGEFWVGARPSLSEVSAELGLSTRPLDELPDALAKDAGTVLLRVVSEADREVASVVARVRQQSGVDLSEEAQREVEDADLELSRHLSVLRTVKDDWEVEQMAAACAASAEAFDAVVADLPEAVRRGRGERWVEGTFARHARHTGNGVGYDSIAAAGDHATTLHWTRNTGEVVDGELLLLDAGVEVDSLFTADITRTLPVNGTFSEAQRRVYDVVLEAQEAGIAAARPGNTFSQIHAAAIRVIATHLHAWGLLPEGVSVEDTLDTEHGQFHRRWMVHGTSHHLGLDVHDCALALREDYLDAELQPGMVLTVEPGLYFKSDDHLVPEELRGIGVRIEDDLVITQDGCRNLSQMLPRTADDVEAWVRSGGRRG